MYNNTNLKYFNYKDELLGITDADEMNGILKKMQQLLFAITWNAID